MFAIHVIFTLQYLIHLRKVIVAQLPYEKKYHFDLNNV